MDLATVLRWVIFPSKQLQENRQTERPLQIDFLLPDAPEDIILIAIESYHPRAS